LFILEKDNNIINFYEMIKKIIPNFYEPYDYIYDNLQESSSCTFFSAYYLIKYNYFEKENFEIFIKNIKKELIKHLFTVIEKNININLLNASFVIIKDHSDVFYIDDINKLKTLVKRKILENNFNYSKSSNINSVTIKKLNITNYNIFKENINFETYNTFINNRYASEDVKWYYSFVRKATYLLIEKYKNYKIMTEQEFGDFYSKIQNIVTTLNYLNKDIVPYSLKLKILDLFICMTENYNIEETQYPNIFNEPDIVSNKEILIRTLTYREFILNDYDFDFKNIIDSIKNKL
jgi:hypothetical protein